MINTQNSRDFLAEFLMLFAAVKCLTQCKNKTNNQAANSLKNIEKDSSVHNDGVYDYDEECLKQKNAISVI